MINAITNYTINAAQASFATVGGLTGIVSDSFDLLRQVAEAPAVSIAGRCCAWVAAGYAHSALSISHVRRLIAEPPQTLSDSLPLIGTGLGMTAMGIVYLSAFFLSDIRISLPLMALGSLIPMRQVLALLAGNSYSVRFEDAVENPRKILLELLPKIENGDFPMIRYQDSDGADLNGLSRDLVTLLFLALFDAKHLQLPVKPSGLPMADPNSEIPIQDQLQCYRAIGSIFAMALRGSKDFTTGPLFHPAFFDMLHALSNEDLSKIPPDLERFDQIPAALADQCLRPYIREELPFMPEEDRERILADDFDEDFRNYSGLDSKDHFIEKIEFSKIALPIFVVAKAMQRSLGRNGDWDKAKKDSANEMRLEIEGFLSPQAVLDALQWESTSESEANENTKSLLTEWISQATHSELEAFVRAATGARSLKKGIKLRIRLFNEKDSLATFNTCSKRMNLPNGYKKEEFQSKLKFAIAESLGAPPQFI